MGLKSAALGSFLSPVSPEEEESKDWALKTNLSLQAIFLGQLRRKLLRRDTKASERDDEEEEGGGEAEKQDLKNNAGVLRAKDDIFK